MKKIRLATQSQKKKQSIKKVLFDCWLIDI